MEEIQRGHKLKDYVDGLIDLAAVKGVRVPDMPAMVTVAF